MTNPARVARLDQQRAHIDEAVNDIIATIRDLHDQPPDEVLCALIEFLAEEPRLTVFVAAGALLRLAQQERGLD